MNQRLEHLRAWARRADRGVRTLMLAPAVMLLSSTAWAELPTMPTPSGGGIGGATPAQGDWLGTMGAWFKAGITILALILVALGFIYVIMGALGKWRAYSMGRAEMADLKEYFIMGSVLAVFLVLIATYALSTLT